VGQWTFESIRRAIKARGRPLTLSFRNDFLTTEQRAILTKAVGEVGAAVPQKPAIQYSPEPHVPDTIPVANSSGSHDTERFVNDMFPKGRFSESDAVEDDLSESVASGYQTYVPTFSAPNTVTTRGNMRSFSEAGSSTSVFSSTLGPLMANLMNGLIDKRNPDSDPTPSYLRDEGESVENTSFHQDFQASLL